MVSKSETTVLYVSSAIADSIIHYDDDKKGLLNLIKLKRKELKESKCLKNLQAVKTSKESTITKEAKKKN